MSSCLIDTIVKLTSTTKVINENWNLLLLLLEGYLPDNDWRDFMIATHRCGHSQIVCNWCLGYLPGCCVLHLVNWNRRRNLPSPNGSFWYGLTHSGWRDCLPSLQNLWFYETNGIAHVVVHNKEYFMEGWGYHEGRVIRPACNLFVIVCRNCKLTHKVKTINLLN